MDEVSLFFDNEALRAIAKKAIERNTGARGLRSILEETMTQIMFDIPSKENVTQVHINRDCIETGAPPELLYKDSPALSAGA